jgi:hypothetical protein
MSARDKLAHRNPRPAACTLALFVTGLAAEAMAGAVYNLPGQVTIRTFSNRSGSATGVLSLIHNGSSVNEYIGCQASGTGLFCHARDELATNHAACSSSSRFLAQAVSTLAPDTRLTFTWNSNGVCTSITVKHSSEFAGKLD